MDERKRIVMDEHEIYEQGNVTTDNMQGQQPDPTNVNQVNAEPVNAGPVNSNPVNVNPANAEPVNMNQSNVNTAGAGGGISPNTPPYTPPYTDNNGYNQYNPYTANNANTGNGLNNGQYSYTGSYNAQGFTGGNPYYEKFKNVDSGTAEKAAKREARREAKRLARQQGKNSGFGIKLVKCAAVALVFGLVSGSAFSGIVYFTGATGKLGQKTEVTEESGSAKSTVDTEDSSKKNTTADTKIVYTNVTGLEAVSQIVKETMPSIVSITNLTTKSTQWFGQIYTEDVEYAGSGIIVAQDDDYLYIATNNHVVSGANTITVTFADETTAAAEIKGTSPSNDLAVVSVAISELADGTLKNIKVASINSSGDTVVGEAAIAIGNALGYGQSVTTGVISAIDREVTIQDDESGTYYSSKTIQTDAAINPGNSGGALLNAQGEVIGINSSKYSDTNVEGMGFAIPMTQAMPIIQNLIERNEVDETEAAYIGIGGVDVDSSTAETYGMPVGIYITKIYEGSPAAKSDLMVGDFLVAFDGTKVSTMQELQDTLKYYPAGTEVTLTVQRANRGVYEDVEVNVVLGKRAEVNLRN